MRTATRNRKNAEWSHLTKEEEFIAKMKRIYRVSTLYPAGRWLAGKYGKGGRI